MKKLIALLLVCVMMVLLCACGAESAEEKKMLGMLNSMVFGENNTGRALVSGRVDAIFWNRIWDCPTSGCEIAEITEAPENVLCTETYYSDFYVPVFLKSEAE